MSDFKINHMWYDLYLRFRVCFVECIFMSKPDSKMVYLFLLPPAHHPTTLIYRFQIIRSDFDQNPSLIANNLICQIMPHNFDQLSNGVNANANGQKKNEQ